MVERLIALTIIQLLQNFIFYVFTKVYNNIMLSQFNHNGCL